MLALSQLWAKTGPFQSVLTHGLITGAVAQDLVRLALSEGVRLELERVLACSPEEFLRLAGYIASLHDIGKIGLAFQSQGSETKKLLESLGLNCGIPSPVRHEKTTYTALRRIWNRKWPFYADILAAHHQGRSGRGERGGGVWAKLQDDFERVMRREFLKRDEIELPLPGNEDEGAAGALLLGIVILADWIASGEAFADAEEWMAGGAGLGEARRRARDFIGHSGLQAGICDFGEGFTEVWPEIPREGMRELQRGTEALFEEADERISVLLIEAPMGEGKTEAGIYAALKMARQWGKDGFYVALPTAATSNQMVERVRILMERHSLPETVRLLHSTAWLTDGAPEVNSEEADYASAWLQPTRRGLLSQFAVGTVDQAMMAVLMVKYGALRLLGLSGKALIIDELHSYDVYMSEIIMRLLEWCRALEIPVVLLSATLPPDKKGQMLSVYTRENSPHAYPALTAVTESGRVLLREIRSSAKSWTLKIDTAPVLHSSASVAALAMDAVNDGGCVCVLVNTVSESQSVYKAIKTAGFDGGLLLFHARFPAKRRDAIERECIRLFGKDRSCRPRKAILVATQVVEQSLDLDFDAMLSSIAPIDLLLQRAGRIHRHDGCIRPAKLSEPRLTVLVPAEKGNYGSDEHVYPVCLLNSSLRLISSLSSIAIPEDMPALVEKGYDPAEADPAELEQWAEHLMDGEVKASMAPMCEIAPPEQGYSPIISNYEVIFDDLESSSFLSAKTRLGEPSLRIALLEKPEFDKYAARAVRRDETLILREVSRREARELMLESASVRLKLLGNTPTGEAIEGRGLLSGVRLYLAREDKLRRRYRRFSDGSLVKFDSELGVIFGEEEDDGAEF